jgi:hypothetical protein
MITKKNIDSFLSEALKELSTERSKQVEVEWENTSTEELIELKKRSAKWLEEARPKETAEQFKKEILAELNALDKADSNVVSITSKEKASVSKAEPKLVKLFEYLPAAASSQESEYKWYHFQGEITDSQGNKSILKMTPIGTSKKVKLRFEPSKDSSILDVDESYLGKKVPLVIKVANQTIIEAEVFISVNKDKLIGEGIVIDEQTPNTAIDPFEYFILENSQ